MAKCKFKTKDGWECPLEAEPGKDYCYWHKEEDGKSPINEQIAVLKKQNIKYAYLVRANLKKVDLSFVNLERANLTGAKLEEAILEGANLEKAFLMSINIEKAFLAKANLRGASIILANLSGASLDKATLEGADLMGSNLKEANLRNTNLRGANLEATILKGAIFEGAKATGANLKEASLEGANLKGADLKGVNLKGTTVNEKTIFTSSNLAFTDLYFSYIDGTKTLRNAIFNSKTEINEIVADLLRKKESKIAVLDSNRIKEDHPYLYELLRRKGAMRYTAEDRVFFFDREKRCFVWDPGGECIETEKPEEIKKIAKNLDKYLLQNPPRGDEEDPKKYKRDLIINLYEASYDVFNMLYYFYIQNGKLEEALEMHRRRSDVRRKLLMARGGLKNKLRAVLYDWFILKFLTGYGLNVFCPILLSFLIIVVFALLFWATGGIVKIVNGIPYKPDFCDYLYHSIITFTSLGYSNIVPNLEIGHLAQGLVAAESILGAFLIALIIFTITYRVSK